MAPGAWSPLWSLKQLGVHMKRFCISTIIGVIAACVLSWFRGGTDDAPWIFASFVAFGFFCSLLLWWLFSVTTLGTIEAGLLRLPCSSAVRNALALAVTASLVLWSGSVITSQGYAGWLYMLLFSIFCPLLVCLLAARFSVLFGVLAATSIVVSLVLANARLDSPQRGHSWQSFRNGSGTWIEIWLIAVGLSLIVSIPIYVQRKRRNSSP